MAETVNMDSVNRCCKVLLLIDCDDYQNSPFMFIHREQIASLIEDEFYSGYVKYLGKFGKIDSGYERLFKACHIAPIEMNRWNEPVDSPLLSNLLFYKWVSDSYEEKRKKYNFPYNSGYYNFIINTILKK